MLQALERTAEADEWAEFLSLRPADDVDFWILTMGGAETARSREVSRYGALWKLFFGRAREKLISGKWVADGCNPQFGIDPLQIPARLWKTLEIAPGHDDAKGGEYSFSHLTIAEVRSPSKRDLRARPQLKIRLVRWIEQQAKLAGGPMTAKEIYAAAQRAFDEHISRRLFNEALSASNTPKAFRYGGRPKS